METTDGTENGLRFESPSKLPETAVKGENSGFVEMSSINQYAMETTKSTQLAPKIRRNAVETVRESKYSRFAIKMSRHTTVEPRRLTRDRWTDADVLPTGQIADVLGTGLR